MKKLLDCRDDAYEVCEVTALQDVGKQEDHHEEVCGSKAIRPSRF
jgi:hypothetical protein